ncbi:hypothetical protein Tco_0457982 [Tanacetum coccineum]
MDFVNKLGRTSSGYDTIWVIVDCLAKSAYFLLIKEMDNMERLARLYLKEIISKMEYQYRLSRTKIADLLLAKVSPVAYKLDLPRKLSRIHNTFHVSNLKKCLSDKNLVIPLKEIQHDDKMHFIEEPIEVMDREVKQLKQSCIPIVKVRGNSR